MGASLKVRQRYRLNCLIDKPAIHLFWHGVSIDEYLNLHSILQSQEWCPHIYSRVNRKFETDTVHRRLVLTVHPRLGKCLLFQGEAQTLSEDVVNTQHFFGGTPLLIIESIHGHIQQQ